MSFYNTHSHIFNVPCVPDAFLTNYKFPTFLGGLVRAAVHNKLIRKTMLGILNRIPIRVGGMQLRRYAALVEVAVNRYQEEVFRVLKDNYMGEARFVLLTMNFDYMTGEAPAGNYNHYSTQLHEVLEVKRFYNEKALPFLFIDPRAGAAECIKLLEHYFDPNMNRGMIGIKIYPSLGYYPFHPNLEKVYAFAEKYQIPIVTHAYKGGGAYYTGRFTPQVMAYNSFNPTADTKSYLNVTLDPFPTKFSSQQFANVMMHPMTYFDVLRKFKKLKICLAHYGGADEVVSQYATDEHQQFKDKFNWTRTIKSLMNEFENVYTDVSFTLKDNEANKFILKDMSDPVLSPRILFGTDFFMTSPFDTDKILLENFFKMLAPFRKELTDINPTRFLTSTFYHP